MAQSEPQRKETPPGPSPNLPSLLFEYRCRIGKVIRLANRVESKLFLPELECSTAQALSVARKRRGSLPEHQHSPSHRLTALLFRWLFSRNTSFFARHFVWGTVGGGVDDVLHHAIIRDGFVHDLSSSTVVKPVVQDS